MRVFIGVELPDVLKDSVAALASRVRKDIARAAPDAQVRWVPPSNLHITVWFLGEVREPRVEPLVAALTPPLDARSFTLRIGGGGAFPKSGAPRAIWLGLASGREELVAVHEQLRGRLVPIGFAPEARPYSPHLTIARVKDVRPRDARAMRGLLGDIAGDIGQCEVQRATLFVSRPTRTGAEHEPLCRVQLAS
jgi:RNA 2',3'-cyclic 3'-phosphodiesterase